MTSWDFVFKILEALVTSRYLAKKKPQSTKFQCAVATAVQGTEHRVYKHLFSPGGLMS